MDKLGRKHRLGKRFDDALAYALRLHRKQARKGKPVPYASHLLGTAGTVLDHGGRPRLAKIRRRFGPDVARMVEDCTDTFERKKPDWRPRKAAYIASLRSKGARSLLVSAADKLDNARAIVADLRKQGPRTLERFNGKRDTVWYFQELVKAFRRRRVGSIAVELEAVVNEMALLAGRDPGKSARPGTPG
jgi:(p)ppGpp synthase/HD superfamily hydrolase